VKTFIKVFVVVIALLGVSQATAQTGSTRSDMPTSSVITDNVYGLGISVNMATGSGFSFKHHLGGIPLAYKLTGYGFKSGFVAWCIGAEIEYDLLVQPEGRLYVLGGLSRYWYESESGLTKLNDPNRFGIGVGYEAAITDAFGISFDLTLTSFQPTTSDLWPLPGAGAYIYF
jgi:hypothetical protein